MLLRLGGQDPRHERGVDLPRAQDIDPDSPVLELVHPGDTLRGDMRKLGVIFLSIRKIM